jgi:lipopolysaccharide export system protein LptA
MLYSEKGDALRSGTAQGGVTLTSSPKPGAKMAEMRRLQCDRVDFGFFPTNNRLQSMAGRGNVQVRYGKAATAGLPAEEFQTSSASIRAQFREADGGAEAVTQSGGFTYQDGTRSAMSGSCDFADATQKLLLTDHPSISDPDSSTSGDQIEFDRQNKILMVHRNVRSIMKASSSRPQGFLTSAADSSSPAIVTSDEMQYWTDQIRALYSGNVFLRSTDSQLHAQSLLIMDRGEKVEAKGDVRHYIQKFATASPKAPPSQVQNKDSRAPGTANSGDPVEIRSGQLQYAKAGNSIHYDGGVLLDSTSSKLKANSLDVFLDADGKKVDRAKARGQVVITQPMRELRGTEADYDLTAGVVVVIGTPYAEFFDFSKKEKPTRSTAARLTFYITDDRIEAGPLIRR